MSSRRQMRAPTTRCEVVIAHRHQQRQRRCRSFAILDTLNIKFHVSMIALALLPFIPEHCKWKYTPEGFTQVEPHLYFWAYENVYSLEPSGSSALYWKRIHYFSVAITMTKECTSTVTDFVLDYCLRKTAIFHRSLHSG